MLPVSARIGLRSCSSKTTSSLLEIGRSRSISVHAQIIYSCRHASTSISRATKSTLRSLKSNSKSSCRTIHRPASTSSNTSIQPLNWNNFFALRLTRRRFNLASSIFTAISTTGAAFYILSTQPDVTDQLTTLIPADPVVTLGVLTVSSTLVGWLIGPIFGSAIWRLLNGSRLPAFLDKERQFFERIKKRRVNPMGASTNNPVPDFYGEKISSVQGYRRWLKDQRAFNRKREGVYGPV